MAAWDGTKSKMFFFLFSAPPTLIFKAHFHHTIYRRFSFGFYLDITTHCIIDSSRIVFVMMAAEHLLANARGLRVSSSFLIPEAIARQAPLSMGFPRQEYWSGLPLPAPGDLPDPGIEPTFPALAGGFFTTVPRGKSCPFIS